MSKQKSERQSVAQFQAGFFVPRGSSFVRTRSAPVIEMRPGCGVVCEIEGQRELVPWHWVMVVDL